MMFNRTCASNRKISFNQILFLLFKACIRAHEQSSWLIQILLMILSFIVQFAVFDDIVIGDYNRRFLLLADQNIESTHSHVLLEVIQFFTNIITSPHLTSHLSPYLCIPSSDSLSCIPHAANGLCVNLQSFPCDNIDVEKQVELAQRLLLAVVGQSIKKHPRQITGVLNVLVLCNVLPSGDDRDYVY